MQFLQQIFNFFQFFFSNYLVSIYYFCHVIKKTCFKCIYLVVLRKKYIIDI